MPDNIFRVTTIASMYGQQIQNVFHLTGPSDDPAETQAVAEHVAANWIPNIRTGQTSALVYNGIKVRLLESQFPPFVKTINLAGGFGFDDEVSTVLCFIMRLRTPFIGRHGRGRLYLGGVLKGWTKNGLVTDAIINAWNARFATLLGIYGPGGSSVYDLVLCPPKPPFARREVTSIQLAPTLGTQRRRNIGIGV